MLSGAALAFTPAVGITADAAEATLLLANPIVDRWDGMLDQMRSCARPPATAQPI